MLSKTHSCLFVLITLAAGQLVTANPAIANCAAEATQGVNWQDCRKRNLMLEDTDLSDAMLERTDLTSTDLHNSKLDNARLHKAVLVRASLSGGSALDADFTKVLGYRTNFSNANFEGSSFENAEISRSDFTGSNLKGVTFQKADLARGNFSGANLTNSSFNSANLSRANLDSIKFDGQLDFTDAFLMQTQIAGLDLSRATGLAQWQVNMACGDDKTVLPEGLEMPQHWPCPPKEDGED